MICRCPVPVESLGSALRCVPLLAGRSSPAAADRLHLHHTSASALASAAAIRSRGTHRRTGPVLQVTQVQLWAISGRSPHWEQDPNYMYISKFTYTIGCFSLLPPAFRFPKSEIWNPHPHPASANHQCIQSLLSPVAPPFGGWFRSGFVRIPCSC